MFDSAALDARGLSPRAARARATIRARAKAQKTAIVHQTFHRTWNRHTPDVASPVRTSRNDSETSRLKTTTTLTSASRILGIEIPISITQTRAGKHPEFEGLPVPRADPPWRLAQVVFEVRGVQHDELFANEAGGFGASACALRLVVGRCGRAVSV
jgi:hypothetical protein